MARSFANGNQMCYAANNAGYSATVSMAGWFYLNSVPAEQDESDVLLHLIRNTGNQYLNVVVYRTGGDIVLLCADNYSRFVQAYSTVPLGRWFHVAATSSPSARCIYLNGGSRGQLLGDTTLTNAKLFSVGSFIGYTGGVVGVGMIGRAAEVGLWQSELSASAVLALSRGAKPASISPYTLLHYHPLSGRYGNNDKDWGPFGNRYPLTPSNSPTWAPDPPTITPQPKRFWQGIGLKKITASQLLQNGDFESWT
jgi:hypothetical protein